jgi:diadenosine tetraphosphatase ApaH/serine/threonine PP2A family protein phosphatase
LDLLNRLGWRIEPDPDGPAGTPLQVQGPAGRKLIFLGDIVDRGPHSPEALRLVMCLVELGHALCVPGNREVRLIGRLRKMACPMDAGQAEHPKGFGQESPEFLIQALTFLQSLPGHLVLDGGRLVVAHAGMRADLQGLETEDAQNFALYGSVDPEADAFKMPPPDNWAGDYQGSALVVYGHTPIARPRWHNRTIDIDTGCVLAGNLTALRYPELELVSTPARAAYVSPVRPLPGATDER